MAERINPVYNLLRIPALYSAVQGWFGSDEIRRALLSAIGASAGNRILDVGSGVSTILADLPDGVEYWGFEPNPAYVAKARAIYGTRGKFQTGYFDHAAAGTVGLVDITLVKAVLHHMSDQEAGALFSLLARVTKPGGRVVTFDNAYVPHQNTVARLLISLDRGRNVRVPEAYAALARPYFGDVRGSVHHTRFPPYTYWIMTASDPRLSTAIGRDSAR